MKTAVVAATALIAALLVAGTATTVFAHQMPNGLALGQSATATTQGNHDSDGSRHHSHAEPQGRGDDGENNRLNLTVGQTITLSNLDGRYVDASNHAVRGNASGSLTLKVTGVFKQGFTLSITSGSFTIGSTTYTITGGSVELGPFGQWASGSGTTSTGQFIINIGIHGVSTSSPNAKVQVDLKSGTSEFLVRLGTPHPDESDS